MHKREREISDQHLGEFKPEGSLGLKFIQELCPTYSLTRESLVVLARLFSAMSSVPFPRDFTRRRGLIIKWFTDHIVELEPLGTLITLEADFLQTRPGGIWRLAIAAEYEEESTADRSLLIPFKSFAKHCFDVFDRLWS
jgi:hypothetical protein